MILVFGHDLNNPVIGFIRIRTITWNWNLVTYSFIYFFVTVVYCLLHLKDVYVMHRLLKKATVWMILNLYAYKRYIPVRKGYTSILWKCYLGFLGGICTAHKCFWRVFYWQIINNILIRIMRFAAFSLEDIHIYFIGNMYSIFLKWSHKVHTRFIFCIHL